MKNTNLYLAIFGFVFFASAHSAEVSSVVNITAIHPIGNERPSNSVSQDWTRVYFDGATWSSGLCGTGAGDISKVDSHLLSILLSATALGKQVTVFVETNLKPIDNNCRITALHINL